MKKLLSAVLALSVLATPVLTANEAMANSKNTAYALGGILGGLVIGSALHHRPSPPPPAPAPTYYYYPQPVPAPVYYQPAPPPVAAPAPWTGEWYEYCRSRYRSFDANTGYFTGYDGRPYFCR